MTTKQVEQLLGQAQIYQQQMQAVLTQKNAIMLELNEMEKALDEMEKTKEKYVYRVTGPILIRSDIEDVKKDLKDTQDFLNVRKGVMEKQEAGLKEKMEELRAKLMGSIPKTRSDPYG